MLIITGTPRSGSTRFAAFLRMMGQDIRGLWIPSHMPGGLEDEGVRMINKQIIEKGRSDELDSEIRNFAIKTVKEPRFATLGKPELIETWYQLRPDIKLIILKRDFRDVGCSLHSSAHIKAMCESPEEDSKLIEVGFNTLLSVVNRLCIPNKQFEFPDFCNQRDYMLESLRSFAQLELQPNALIISQYKCKMGSAEDVWDQWFDASKARVYGPDGKPVL